MELQPDRLKELAEMRLALKKLEEYADQGFLFHGSKQRVATLEPRQANDVLPEKQRLGNLKAVYALDRVRLPIVVALMDKKDKNAPGWKSELSDDGTTLVVGGENYAFSTGYVHVLPADSFERLEEPDGNYEIVSRSAVTAVDIIEVKPSIIELLENVVIRDSR